MIIDQPEPADVICGRGKNSFRHAGNDVFRQLIVKYVSSYKQAPPKNGKSQVVMLVVNEVIRNGGRFLVRVKEKNGWVDGGVKQGQKKTGHAFRDALRGRVKCLATEEQVMMRRARTTSAFASEASVQAAHAIQMDELRASGFLCPEPSRDWMTPSSMIDSEVRTYLRNLFLRETLVAK